MLSLRVIAQVSAAYIFLFLSYTAACIYICLVSGSALAILALFFAAAYLVTAPVRQPLVPPLLFRPINFALLVSAIFTIFLDQLTILRFLPFLANLNFARVGHVSQYSANLAFRYKMPSTTGMSLNDYWPALRVRILSFDPLNQNPENSTTELWLPRPHLVKNSQKCLLKSEFKPKTNTSAADLPEICLISDDSDENMLTIRLDRLRPSTRYCVFIVTLNGDQSATACFRTRPDSALLNLPYINKSQIETHMLRLVFGSCINPRSPFISSPRARGLPGLKVVRALNPDVFLFLGDFIYADGPLQLGMPYQWYRAHYLRVFSLPETNELLSNIPSYFIYDDHEFKNNWGASDLTASGGWHPSLTAFHRFLGNTNPIGSAPGGIRDGAYFTIDYSPLACFFVLDTRLKRNRTTKTMLGRVQLKIVKKWLLDDSKKCIWSFLISPVPMTRNWHIDSDTWSSFLDERDEILLFIQENMIKNIVVLSGDRHTVGVQILLPSSNISSSSYDFPTNSSSAKISSTLGLNESSCPVIEFSNSPISAFYPPVNVYDRNGGDAPIYDHRKGSVKIGKIDIFKEYLRYSVVDRNKFHIFNYTWRSCKSYQR